MLISIAKTAIPTADNAREARILFLPCRCQQA
jgi:hypothetical protein